MVYCKRRLAPVPGLCQSPDYDFLTDVLGIEERYFGVKPEFSTFLYQSSSLNVNLWNINLKQKKQNKKKQNNIYVCFSSEKKLGMVGRHYILFYRNILYGYCIFYNILAYFLTPTLLNAAKVALKRSGTQC